MSETTKRILTAIPLVFIIWVSLLYAPQWLFQWIVLATLGYVIAFELPSLRTPWSVTFWVLALFYLIVPCLILLLFHAQAGPIVTLFFILCVGIHDAASYFVGKNLGRHRLAPSISPKKSWEGFLGGLAATGSFVKLAMPQAPVLFIALLTAALCSSALAGDLFESWLKRTAGLKDSGTILPGHGGVLDRIDAALFAIIVVYFFKDALIGYLSR